MFLFDVFLSTVDAQLYFFDQSVRPSILAPFGVRCLASHFDGKRALEMASGCGVYGIFRWLYVAPIILLGSAVPCVGSGDIVDPRPSACRRVSWRLNRYLEMHRNRLKGNPIVY